MARIIFNISLDTFLHDLAEGYQKGCYSTVEYLDIMATLADQYAPTSKTQHNGR